MNASRYRGLALPVALLAVSLAAAGCGRDATPNAPSPSSGLSRQAADDVARHFAGTLARGGVPLSRVGGTTLPALARGQALSLAPSRTHRLTDEIGFSWSFSVTFFDAAGVQQPIYDPGSTARMSLVARARGSLSTAEHQATVGIHRALDVGGLLPTETTLEIDGAANDTADCWFDARDGSASRQYHLVGAGALDGVRQLKDESVNPYPLSGTARWEVAIDAEARDGDGTRTAHYDATVLVTFNGTRRPIIEIDEHYAYSFDLETGEIQRLPS